MIVRDADGKLWIINRKDCKNNASYYEKIYEIKKSFVTKMKEQSETESQSTVSASDIYKVRSKHFTHDIDCEDEDE